MGAGPLTHFLHLKAPRENSSFIIHCELLEFRFFPYGALMPFYLFIATPYLAIQ